ncbi:hydroxyethylthiazole kinase [Halalkalibacterium halodurans]|uniref:hydroxyethylthiazole kinase n=1 Tax=Halalkalibacterium halodurans TaxID=86665 RepID=UPI002E1D2503|nr:hydroxyethylthiazole kinase [Halalkalibacterium halodurans]MED3648762.1 hydroxyethylthiazole kinase [Halalkalibacterium halodurans]
MSIEMLRKSNPLIHCMTNVVVTNFTANGLLAVGASPVMAYAKEEVADMAKVANALLLNIGTLSAESIDNMIIAGKAANKAGTPVVLDPVGAGATAFRTESCKRILKEVDVTIVRGNGGEIATLSDQAGTVKGVDGSIDSDPVELAKHAANVLNSAVVVTGEVDVVTDGTGTVRGYNGHPWLTKVVGTGCLSGAIVAAFASLKTDDLLEVIGYGLVAYGVAAEKAYEETKAKGYGSFQTAFLNQLGRLTDEDVKQHGRFERS